MTGRTAFLECPVSPQPRIAVGLAALHSPNKYLPFLTCAKCRSRRNVRAFSRYPFLLRPQNVTELSPCGRTLPRTHEEPIPHAHRLLFAVSAVLAVGCTRTDETKPAPAGAVRHRGRREKTNITVKGSDTMVILGQRWAEAYMKEQPRHDHPGHRRRLGHRHRRAHQRLDRHLRVEPPDEGQREGRREGQAQRPARRDQGRARRARRLREREEPAQEISIPALAQDLPRRDQELERRRRQAALASCSTDARTTRARTATSRSTCSRTRTSPPSTQTLAGTSAVANAVKGDEFGIGYGGIAYLEGIRR